MRRSYHVQNLAWLAVCVLALVGGALLTGCHAATLVESEAKTTNCVNAKTWGGGNWSPECPSKPTPNLPMDSLPPEKLGECIIVKRGDGWLQVQCPWTH